MDRLLIIDGSSMLTTAFFGNLPNAIKFAKTDEEKEKYFHTILHTTDGRYTNAVYGMLRQLIRIKKDQTPEYMAICFDETRDTFRRAMYPEYKAQRSKPLLPLKEQFGTMIDILHRLGIYTISSAEYEADDLAASLAYKFKGQLPVMVMTKDKDYYQLPQEGIDLWMQVKDMDTCMELKETYGIFSDYDYDSLPPKVMRFDAETVKAETGVYPEQIPDLKGIVGDTSDNIPGVKGVSSAAAPLIAEYGSLENLFKAIHSTARKELVEHWKSLGITRSPYNAFTKEGAEDLSLLSKKLATMITDVPEACITNATLSNMRFSINQSEWDAIKKEFHFSSL